METLLRTNHVATSQGTHSHDHPQILIGHQGIMQCELPGSSGTIARGSIGVLPGAVEHYYQGRSETCRLLVIDINPEDVFINALEEVCLSSVKARLLDQPELLGPTPSVLSLLDWADVQLQHTSLHDRPAFQYQLITVFLTHLMMHDGHGSPVVPVERRLDRQRLDSYIDKHLYRGIDNDELANLCYVSTSHLYVLMRQLSGLSPQQYVASRRMIKARTLLINRKLSLGQIAEMVGFSDGASFSRAYRRHFAEAPSKIRG